MRSALARGAVPRTSLNIRYGTWVRFPLHSQPDADDDANIIDARGVFPTFAMGGTTSTLWDTAGFMTCAGGEHAMVSAAVIQSFFRTANLPEGGGFLFWLAMALQNGASGQEGILSYGNKATGDDNPGFHVSLSAALKPRFFAGKGATTVDLIADDAISDDDSLATMMVYARKATNAHWQFTLFPNGGTAKEGDIDWELYPHPSETESAYGFLLGSIMLDNGAVNPTARLEYLRVADINLVRTPVDISDRVAAFERAMRGAPRDVPHFIRHL